MPAEFDTEDQDQEIETVSEDTEAEESADSQGSEPEQEDAAAEEQDDESQDDEDAEDTEEGQEEKAATGVKNQKTGNFDWKKINEKIGNGEVERAFKESQRTISRVSQENKQYREQVANLPSLQEKAEQFEWFDHLVRSNPALRSQIQAVLSGGKPEMEQQNHAQNQLPPGVHPEDPLAPLLMQQMQKLSLFEQRFQQEDQSRQQHQVQERFRQGLIEAKDRFKQLVGKEITEQQLRSVAQKMQSLRINNGADLVPSLFIADIQKATQQKFFASRQQKKNLPKTPNGVRSNTKTAKPKSVREAFDDAWDAQENGD